MTTLTEGRHAAEFVLSEAAGTRSRESAAIDVGQDLDVGQIVEDDGSGNLTAMTGTLNTAGALITQAKGILLYAGVSTTAVAQTVAYIARDAEVNGNLLTFPTETSTGDERNLTIASLALLGIIVRD
jgi:hypothetical protein